MVTFPQVISFLLTSIPQLFYIKCSAWPEKPGGPGGTFPSGTHKFHFLGGTRGTQYITKMDPFYFSWTVFQQLQ